MMSTEIESIITRLIGNGVTHEDYNQISSAADEIMELIPHWALIEEVELVPGERYDVFSIEKEKYHNMTFGNSTVESYFFWTGFAIMHSNVTHVMKSIPDPII